MLEHALSYAVRGWRIMPLHNIVAGICSCRPSPNRLKAGAECPSPGKHPKVKTGRAFAAATTDEAQIRSWWKKWPQANIGIATGSTSGICVVDLDGQKGFDTLKALLNAAGDASGALPTTLMAASGREGVGAHLYFACTAISPSNSGDGLDIRGDGGLVVAPPSMHISGRPYTWLNAADLAPMPPWLLDWFANREGRGRSEAGIPTSANLPAHLQGRAGSGLLRRGAIADLADPADIHAAIEAIPNVKRGWDDWNRIGMAIWAASGGSEDGFAAFDDWSAKSEKYDPDAVDERWRAYAGTPPDSLSFGTLWHEAKLADPSWLPPSQHIVETVPQEQKQFQHLNGHANGHASINGTNGKHVNGTVLELASNNPDNPLIEFNKKFCVIGNIGGKCMVMEWIPSPAEQGLKIPSFQTFKTISERYAHRYINVATEKKTRDGEVEKGEESKQLGPYWLKWNGRRNYERLDLDPTGPALLPGNILNLWTGYGVEPKPGTWARMQRHVMEVLADGDPACAAYIFRWAAWAVQHAGEPGEVALVFRGGKGVGKGTFGHAVRRLFGQHGLYISHSKHMVGQFNGHLRSTILLLADEAFWAGDKQGQSSLQAMLTEPVLMVENKGIDASQIKNRLHVIMLANAEWVVPASADERRYAVFNVSSRHQRDASYFQALRDELDNGGLEAMLYDLQQMKLGTWHPREVIQTTALQQQKAASLNALQDWYAGVLSEAYPPGGRETRVPAAALLHVARESTGKLRDLSPQALGRFLKKHGVKQVHTPNGSAWQFPELKQLRTEWEKEFGAWAWESDVEAWRTRV